MQKNLKKGSPGLKKKKKEKKRKSRGLPLRKTRIVCSYPDKKKDEELRDFKDDDDESAARERKEYTRE